MKKLLWAWQSSPANVGFSLNKYSLIGLLYQGTENCLSRPDLISNGFCRAGIHPWNKAAPDKAKLLPGTVFEAETTIVPETVPLVDLETVNENNVDTPVLQDLFVSTASSSPTIDTINKLKDKFILSGAYKFVHVVLLTEIDCLYSTQVSIFHHFIYDN